MTALKRLFGDGFRVFFLSAGLFALLSVMVWELYLGVQVVGGTMDLLTAAPPHQWHAHEMIFGYGAAALGGFLLTAVPNWTGARSAPHRFIALAAGLWLAGRLAVWGAALLPALVVAVADLAFIPVLAGNLLTQLIRRPKPQHLVFLVLLALFWVANLMVHLEWLGVTADTLWPGMRAGLLTLGAMIMILGGRVTPGFTKNAMVQSGRESGLPWNPMPLAGLAIAAAMALPVGYLLGGPERILAVLALVAGGTGLVRVALWQGRWTLDKPILWSLHLSYALNALGFVALGFAGLDLFPEVAALHLLGIGGVGGMTLAVMSRATLGHTGRALVAPGPVALAYALVPMAALARLAGSVFPAHYMPVVLTSGLLWLLAFALYTLSLWPAFWGPRLPRAAVGKPPP